MITQEVLQAFAETYLADLISGASGARVGAAHLTAPFQELGVDSFKVLKIVKDLEKDFGTLPKTLLFENFNIQDLARYLVRHHEARLETKMGNPASALARQATVPAPSPAPIPAPAPATVVHRAPALAASRPAPILVPEKQVLAHPRLGPMIGEIFARHKNEGSVSRGTRNIAPDLFIGSERKGYFNYSRSGDILLAYAYTGPDDYFPRLAGELLAHCRKLGLQLNFFIDQEVRHIGDVAFSSNPFGAVQRILDLKEFSLQGNKMRRLRYQVSKFAESGACRTVEYRCGTAPETDRAIADIVDRWCESRTMVNPLIHIVKQEILDGTLHGDHRIFLTYQNDLLQNVILISPMVSGAYLMDLEFYPKEMPLGGLEFAIVEIIRILVEEGCDMLSLGATFGVKLAPSGNADPRVEAIVDKLREQKLFDDSGNLQFKNKFRTENRSIFLCRAKDDPNPDNVTDIILMIADPGRMRTSDEANHSSLEAEQGAARASGGAPPGRILAGNPRSARLAESGYNPLRLPADTIEFDLKTDSWLQLKTHFVRRQMDRLHSELARPVDIERAVRSIFPFKHFLLAKSGRAAERIFYKAFPKKGIILENLLFPTAILHQIDNGFSPVELAHPEALKPGSAYPFKGNLDLDGLTARLRQDAGRIAMVCVELSDNGAGGYAVSLDHLAEVKARLAPHGIPLVLDATRILENALVLARLDEASRGKTAWALTGEILKHADAIVASLGKDFGVSLGGLVATSDGALFKEVERVAGALGDSPNPLERRLIGHALSDRKRIEHSTANRLDMVQRLWQKLNDGNLPVLGPSGTHGVIIDVKRIPEFRGMEHPVASFCAWLFLNTGIRAGAHNAGMQKDGELPGCARLAIPVGLGRETIDSIADRLLGLFESKENIPELMPESDSPSVPGTDQRYCLKAFHNLKGTLADSPEKPQEPVSGPLAPEEEPAPGVAAKAGADFGEIAVIGMAGRYPGAESMDALWENLVQGRDCVTELPPERMALRRANSLTRKYRGGFIKDVDKFDSLFFNISPREAEIMDPQERLFLEVAWETLEDAGYYPEKLSKATRKVGVFVGAVWTLYQVLGAEEKALAANEVHPNSFLWSIANRISYWMNFTGPSLTLDTACSSSLTALYLACEAIRKGECAAALVGGVNLDLHQHKIDINTAGGAISPDGVCRSFGDNANGYVAGEGIGALLLKPLAAALRDRDNIHGIIKGVAVNHGGKTSGYMVPSPAAQAELIESALRIARVDARSIGYIEAHGTGTELGDPIEISGLTKAFATHNVPNQSCSVGSVKTNIGHLEAAAGIVGIAKALLQMKYGKLVPSLHSGRLNRHIEFAQTPFQVEQALRDFPARVVDGKTAPSRSGVSSFGAGGANAHVILEAFPRTVVQEQGDAPLLFPMSAKSAGQLVEVARRLLAYVEKRQGSPWFSMPHPADIAHTLQTGRKAFDHRLVIVAKDCRELGERLRLYLADGADGNVFAGQAKADAGILKFLGSAEKDELVRILWKSGDPYKLSQAWIEGILDELNPSSGPDRTLVSLPTYPFADKRHWITRKQGVQTARDPAASGARLHPLIDANESTFEKQLYRKKLDGKEALAWGLPGGTTRILPGLAVLEMAKEAGALASSCPVKEFRDLVWEAPLLIGPEEMLDLHLELQPKDGSVSFDLAGKSPTRERIAYAKGWVEFPAGSEESPAPAKDLAAIERKCQESVDVQAAYRDIDRRAFTLAAADQVLERIRKGPSEALGYFGENRDSGKAAPTPLDPRLLGGILHLALACGFAPSADSRLLTPHMLRRAEIHGGEEAPACVHILVKEKAGNLLRLDATLFGAGGSMLARLGDLILLSEDLFALETARSRASGSFIPLAYDIAWKSAPMDSFHGNPARGGTLYFEAEPALHMPDGKSACVIPGEGYKEISPLLYQINPRNPKDYLQVLDSLATNRFDLGRIGFAWAPAEFESGGRFSRGALDRGIYSFLILCQALIEKKLEGQVKLVYLSLGRDSVPQPQNEAVSGFVRTLKIEHAKLACKNLHLVQKDKDWDAAREILEREFSTYSESELVVRYADGARSIRTLCRIEDALESGSGQEGRVGLKHGGTYVITGGAGGLGFIFARHLVASCRAKVVLTGRSKPGPDLERRLEALRDLGGQVLYIESDIANPKDAKRIVRETREKFGSIQGVVHSAGVLRDGYIRGKALKDMEAVVAPKVFGTWNLDSALQDEKLDFFATFSSMAAVGGNLGQCDYAYANHFMDSFVRWREARRAEGRRHGKSLTFNWSIWAEGGMRLDDQARIFFEKNLGIKPLRTMTGLRAFDWALQSDRNQMVVVEAIPEKMETAWGIRKRDASPEPAPAAGDAQAVIDPQGLPGQVEKYLVELVCSLLKLQPGDFTVDQVLTDLGFDSIGLSTVANRINETYGLEITPVLFFEHPHIRGIAGHLAREFRDRIAAKSLPPPDPRVDAAPAAKAANGIAFAAEKPAPRPMPRPAPIGGKMKSARNRFLDQPIAIVGLHAVMPSCEDLNEFWNSLVAGKDLVTTVPEDRWDWRKYDGDPLTQANTTKCRWGGFMREVDKFDAAFFGIPAKEAIFMDPQQRILLECVWKAVEASGHKVADLSGTRTGLFVGASLSDYAEVVARSGIPLDGYSASGNTHALLANRVSYFMDLRGPSAAIDTACSSSLVALHRAIESIHTGSSEMAIVAAVQAILTPTLHISLGMSGMLSKDGKCRAFDQGADGFVRGEGVGAVVLKPLSMAEADGDTIYCLIRSTAENHGGRGTALTAPNPRVQAEVMSEAFRNTDFGPETVGYIECHGTGTPIGDAIEVQAIQKAYGATAHCGLGTVKTNVGHLESVAGMAALCKAVLAIRHRKIPATLHFTKLNPFITLKDGRFTIVDRTRDWEPKRDGHGKPLPLRAGVNSFGFGGANAHAILEEYVPAPSVHAEPSDAPYMLVLSAKTRKSLRSYAIALKSHLESAEVNLADLAYTLQVGRDAMEERLAFLARTREELLGMLREVAEDRAATGIVRGKAVLSKSQEQGNAMAVRHWIEQKDYRSIIQSWCAGKDIDWSELYLGKRPRRIGLPTYQFEKTRFWIGQLQDGPIAPEAPEPAEPIPAPGYEGPSALRNARGFVARLFADQLGAAPGDIDMHGNLLDSGITSRNMVEMTLKLKEAVQDDFSPACFFECTTPSAFAGLLARTYPAIFENMRVDGLPEPDGTAERGPGTASASKVPAHVLDAESFSHVQGTEYALAADTEAGDVLLTGATGFLGIHVLHELLAGGGSTVVRCLVRCQGKEHGLKRILDQAARFGLDLDASRIVVLPGDTNLPKIGLSGGDWERACREIGQIIHASAHVNHIEGYATFRESVAGMKELIRMAGSHRLKLVQFVSSIAAGTVMDADRRVSIFEKEDFIEDGSSVFGGYGQSKWVQERFLMEAGKSGIPYTIFRFGELSGSSRSGLGQTGDVMHRLIQMRMAIGCREKISADVLDMLPVDVAARVIAAAGRSPGRWNRIYHATHPNPCAAAQLYRLAESQGYAFEAVSRERYLSRCMDYARFVASRSPMDGFVLECILRDADGSSRNMVMIDAYFALLFPFNQDNFLALLEGAKIELPDWDHLLELYFRRWSEGGTGLLARAREFIENEAPSDLEGFRHGEAAAAASVG